MKPSPLEKIKHQHQDFKDFVDGDLPDSFMPKYDIENGGLIMSLKDFNKLTSELNNWNQDQMDTPGDSQKIRNIGVWVTLDKETKKIAAVIIPLNSENEIVKGGGAGSLVPPFHK